MTRQKVWLIAVSLLGVAALFVVVQFRSDVRVARDRLEGRSEIILATSGSMEFATAGSGAPLLMIHGTGGGFDQGLLCTEKLAIKGV